MASKKVLGRFILRRTSDGRTMVGGTLLSDLCPDGRERIIQGTVDLDLTTSFVAEDPNVLAGRTMDKLMVDFLGGDYPNAQWKAELDLEKDDLRFVKIGDLDPSSGSVIYMKEAATRALVISRNDNPSIKVNGWSVLYLDDAGRPAGVSTCWWEEDVALLGDAIVRMV